MRNVCPIHTDSRHLCTTVSARVRADQGESNLLVIDDLSVLLLCQVSVGGCDVRVNNLH